MALTCPHCGCRLRGTPDSCNFCGRSTALPVTKAATVADPSRTVPSTARDGSHEPLRTTPSVRPSVIRSLPPLPDVPPSLQRRSRASLVRLLARLLGRSAEPSNVTTTLRPVDISDGRGFNVSVVGESHHQMTLRRIADGRTGPGIDVLFRAWLLAESTNPYDSNAVAIATDDGKQVGYLPREWAKEYHAPLSELRSQDFAPYCVATVIGGYGHKKSFGVLLDVRDPKHGLVSAF
jgi:hypothetical protein